MREVLALAFKDLRLLLRDKVGFIFALVFPLLYAVFFGTIFSGMSGGSSSKLNVAIVDEDQTDESASFIEALAQGSNVNVTVMDRAEAVDLVRRGKRLAYIALPKGFGAKSDGMFMGDPPTLDVGIDPSRQAGAAMLQGVIIKTSFERMQEMFQDPEVMAKRVDSWLESIRASKTMDPMLGGALELFLPALKAFALSGTQEDEDGAPAAANGEGQESSSPLSGGLQPVVINTESIARESVNAYAVSFPQGIIWGVMGCAAAFGISLVVERTSGTLVRLRMAPIARWQILAGKATACFIATVAMITTLLLLATFVFEVRSHSVVLLGLAVISVSLGFVGIMMLLSVLGKTEQAAGGIGWGVLLLMAMLGGGMVPRMVMPSWMKTMSSVSPVRWGIESMEGALWRGYSFSEMILPNVVLIGVGVLCFVVGVRAFKWTD